MAGNSRWGKVILRTLGGGLYGLVCGAVAAGLISDIAGGTVQAVDESLAGLGQPLVFACSAMFAAPGGALSGAYGAANKKPLHAFLVEIAAGFLALLYPAILLVLQDDTSWPYSALVLGTGIIAGPALGGACIAWAARLLRECPLPQIVPKRSLPG